MPILDIVRLGHPVLRTPAEAFDPAILAEPEMQTLIDDMIETMMDAEGVGLAAPQVAVPGKLFVYLALDPDDPDVEPVLRVVVNPEVELLAGDLVDDWEGCLSIPDMRGLVPRHPAVRVQGFDRDGTRLDYRADDFEARVIQHEFDHLHGMVFLDRMHDLRSLAYNDEWDAHMAEMDDADEPASDDAAD